MNRIEDYLELKLNIVEWIKVYVNKNKIKSLVVGVSGGIDSAVVATLCAETGIPTYVLSMPLKSSSVDDSLSDSYTTYLENNYDNVTKIRIDLGAVYQTFITTFDLWTALITTRPLAKTKATKPHRRIVLSSRARKDAAREEPLLVADTMV